MLIIRTVNWTQRSGNTSFPHELPPNGLSLSGRLHYTPFVSPPCNELGETGGCKGPPSPLSCISSCYSFVCLCIRLFNLWQVIQCYSTVLHFEFLKLFIPSARERRELQQLRCDAGGGAIHPKEPHWRKTKRLLWIFYFIFHIYVHVHQTINDYLFAQYSVSPRQIQHHNVALHFIWITQPRYAKSPVCDMFCINSR